MNKTVIKKHTAMSTVLFKKFTAFVVGVISILVMCAGSVSAQTINRDMEKWVISFSPNSIEWSNKNINIGSMGAGWLRINDGAGHALTEGTHFTISFENNKEPGNVTVKILPVAGNNFYPTGGLTFTGINGNGTGNSRTGFKIVKRDINNDVTLTIPTEVNYTLKSIATTTSATTLSSKTSTTSTFGTTSRLSCPTSIRHSATRCLR